MAFVNDPTDEAKRRSALVKFEAARVFGLQVKSLNEILGSDSDAASDEDE